MGNLGTREKYGMFALVIILVLFMIYVFGIRNLDSTYETLTARQTELEDQLAYYDSLKADNEAANQEIATLKNNIMEMEKVFLPEIRTEVIENYIMDVFKKNGCPYLVEIKSADIAAPTVTLPDGTIAQDTLVWKRVTLQYSTTDGFNVNQYNHENTIIVDGVPSLDLFIEKLETMYDLETIMGVGYDENNRIGYDGFVKSMKEIDALDTEAVKINSISAKDEGGYLVLTAEIDFYSATFNSRLSKDENTEPYVVYPDAADKAIKIGHGFIGMPYIVTDTQSAWYNIMVADNLAASSMKPFSTYYSKALFEQLVQAQGLARTLGVEIERPISISDVPTVPPEVADAYSAGLTEGDDATGGLNNE